MATANGSAAVEMPAQGDLQSIPFRGHTIHVWRQPEPTKHAFAWRSVCDASHSVASGEADTAAEAWSTAVSRVSSDGEGQTSGGFDFKRWDSCRWDRLPDYSVEWPQKLDRAFPGLPHRLEGIKYSARGLQCVLRVLMVADMHAEWFRDGQDGQPISEFVVEGLQLAAQQLAERIEDEVNGIAVMGASHA